MNYDSFYTKINQQSKAQQKDILGMEEGQDSGASCYCIWHDAPTHTANMFGGEKMKYQQHALSQAYPAMLPADIGILAVDIEEHGQHDLIVLYDGEILDGWHRYLACLQVKVKPEFINLPEHLDPVAFVRSKNGFRRHLTGSQRAASEVALREWAKVGVNQHPKKGGSAPSAEARAPSTLNTSKEMAKSAGVSVRTIEDAKVAQKAGLGKDVVDGKITAKAAAKIAKPQKPAITTTPEPEHEDNAPTDYDEKDLMIDSLRFDNDRMANLVAGAVFTGSEEERAELLTRMDELVADNNHLHVMNKALTVARDRVMIENKSLKKQLETQRRQLKKLHVKTN